MKGDDMTQFTIGDVVRLKSGGPAMTVVRLGKSILCEWFTGDATYHREFPAAALVAVAQKGEVLPKQPPLPPGMLTPDVLKEFERICEAYKRDAQPLLMLMPYPDPCPHPEYPDHPWRPRTYY
jgi:uncharacterized protein YodC (DUF2158 family)